METGFCQQHTTLFVCLLSSSVSSASSGSVTHRCAPRPFVPRDGLASLSSRRLGLLLREVSNTRLGDHAKCQENGRRGAQLPHLARICLSAWQFKENLIADIWIDISVVLLADFPAGKKRLCGGSWKRIAAIVSVFVVGCVEALRDEIAFGTTLIVTRLNLIGSERSPVVVTFDPLFELGGD